MHRSNRSFLFAAAVAFASLASATVAAQSAPPGPPRTPNAGIELTREARAALPHHLDLAYGTDPKQKLDVYLPVQKPTNAPVLLFLHGGANAQGDRAVYGYIARPFAARNIVTVIASFRLAKAGDGLGGDLPGSRAWTYPAQREDAEALVLWIHRNIAKYGGDPNAIFVAGHSSGAVLAADIGADRSWLERAGISRAVLKGVAPVSGLYDFTVPTGPVTHDFAPTLELKRAASPLFHLNDPAPTWILAYGVGNIAKTEAEFRAPSELFKTKLEEKNATARSFPLPDKTHRETVLELGKEGSPLSEAVIAMIQRK
jgi:arylformamidase